MARYPESYSTIAEVIGEEATRKLCEAFGGEAIYVPKAESVENAERLASIRREYNGGNVALLARRYGLTTRRVQQIVEGEAGTLPGQMDMFEEEK